MASVPQSLSKVLNIKDEKVARGKSHEDQEDCSLLRMMSLSRFTLLQHLKQSYSYFIYMPSLKGFS